MRRTATSDREQRRMQARAAAGAVIDPVLRRSVDELGMLTAVRDARGGPVVEVALPVAEHPCRGELEADLRTVIDRALDGRGTTRVEFTSMTPHRRLDVAEHLRATTPPVTGGLGNPCRVYAVASGKGGVGKSTVAVNLACALARLGLRIGLLDADVYGPSVPRLLGLTAAPRVGPDKRLIPLEAWGVRAASIGFMVDEGAPMIWRGPMASSAVTQLLNEVAWGTAEAPLDVLVIDMPPGTGDVQLTLAQRVALSGAVIVSTPQEIALIDVRRGAAMFAKTGTPILGVVENMAYFPDPATGEPIPIFGRGGARATAAELGAPFLGEVPLDMALRVSGDEGAPLAAAAPDSATARLFVSMAEQIAAALDSGLAGKPPPRIVIED